MEFALFFTRNDATVSNCLELFETFRETGVRHFGFKDVGVERETLQALVAAIHAAGGTSYMEVVSPSVEACLRSVEVAAELGVKRLLGGTQIDEIQAVLAGTNTEFFPAAGRPLGHPLRLEGTLSEIVDDCKRFMDKGCAGVDLLAFRAADAVPLELVAAAREVIKPGGLIVSGSIGTPERVRAIREAGADLFTVGNAVLDCTYIAGETSAIEQAKAMLRDSQQ
ncbi:MULTISPECIES: 4-hydroxythreonine-4-phosphate dehydrogenase [unclassified Paraburkholderia]|uniref:4-hydroxythreonine-4-phosphate dehydrogenase n=1 Tax=unclassified Paraburkholderia TaxID=2615204 RepID=UPI002AB0597D|nr:MULTISPECIES: 4-hydroxythreonine-4-phosphate dehydrogenase [unclassified Paraburkholderia]